MTICDFTTKASLGHIWAIQHTRKHKTLTDLIKLVTENFVKKVWSLNARSLHTFSLNLAASSLNDMTWIKCSGILSQLVTTLYWNLAPGRAATPSRVWTDVLRCRANIIFYFVKSTSPPHDAATLRTSQLGWCSQGSCCFWHNGFIMDGVAASEEASASATSHPSEHLMAGHSHGVYT